MSDSDADSVTFPDAYDEVFSCGEEDSFELVVKDLRETQMVLKNKEKEVEVLKKEVEDLKSLLKGHEEEIKDLRKELRHYMILASE